MIKRLVLLSLIVLATIGLTVAQQDSHAVVQTLQSYAASVQAKNMGEIEKYVVTTDAFTMFEGGHINWGWADYRDHHLGPELKQFLEFQYSYEDIRPHVMGETAYATLKYRLAIKTKEREVDGSGLATVILTNKDGDWKILHMHTSRIPNRDSKS